jgi:hypothetical protein
MAALPQASSCVKELLEQFVIEVQGPPGSEQEAVYHIKDREIQYRERKKERKKDIQKEDRQTDRQTERTKERKKERKTDRKKERNE